MMCSMKRALALLSFVMLVGVASGWAQGTASFLLTTTPTDVARTGRSEVLGQVQLTAPATCASHGCGTSAGSIVITYLGVQLDNSTGTGIQVCELVAPEVTPKCSPTAGTYITGTVTVSNPPQGGTVSFGVNALTSGSTGLSAGDQVTIEGARGRIDLSSYNTPFGSAPSSSNDIPAELTASPSTIASATPVQQTVARAKDAMTIKVSAADILECIGTGTPTVTVEELFASAFVDHTSPPSDPRPLFGGNANTEVNLVVSGLPSGVTLTWPLDSFTDPNSDSVLTLVSQTAKGDQATYVFTTPDQATSDTFLESWQIGDGDTVGDSGSIQVGLSGTNADFGTAGVAAQLYPPALPSTNRPRYNDPLHPGPLPFLQIGPCTTTLLFPWVTNQFGFDTGIVLANTSRDITNDAHAIIVSNPTPLEHGTCALYGFPQGEGAELYETLPKTGDVSAGDVTTTVLGSDSVFRGFQGYIIARCNFQYGHGYAYVVNNNLGGQGSNYLALIIPDPVVMDALGSVPSRSAGPFIPTSDDEEDGTFVYSNTNSGEQLDN